MEKIKLIADMENFVVSARKYRPASFDTVIGQGHVVQTLKNAIKNKHLAHAFLFCGPRGVGKTTSARLLAKTINCTNLTPELEACNNCDSCKAFNNNASFNIYELDAASNNSVDDIRALVDQVRYAPQGATYKIYIIDEVHMLSANAFNAFLKTLEEPPPYAKFILATTEKHKILPTIISRCQVFDFHRIKIEDAVKQLREICDKENIIAEDDALHIIAQKADGAMRDALSIFDRIVSFSGNNIKYQDVINNLNILDYDYYFKAVNLLLNEDLAGLLLLFDDILNNGFDALHFIGGFSEHIRNLMVCKHPDTVKLLEVSQSVSVKFLEQAKSCNTALMLNALNLLNKCELDYKSSKNTRLHVELCLMKLSHIQSYINLQNSNVDLKKKIVDFSDSATETKPVAPINTASTSLATLINTDTNKIYNEPISEILSIVQDPKSVATTLPPISKTGGMFGKKTDDLFLQKKEQIAEKLKIETVILNNEVLETSIENVVENQNEKYSETDLNNAWNAFIAQLDKASLSFMKERKLVIQDNDKISVIFASNHEKTLCEDQRLNVLQFFRINLKNTQINLEFEVDNTLIPVTKSLSVEDKFNKMLEQNPDLATLRQLLELEIEY